MAKHGKHKKLTVAGAHLGMKHHSTKKGKKRGRRKRA